MNSQHIAEKLEVPEDQVPDVCTALAVMARQVYGASGGTDNIDKAVRFAELAANTTAEDDRSGQRG